MHVTWLKKIFCYQHQTGELLHVISNPCHGIGGIKCTCIEEWSRRQAGGVGLVRKDAVVGLGEVHHGRERVEGIGEAGIKKCAMTKRPE